MIFDARCKSKHVVVDTTAFIRNANLQDIGENIITVPEVLNEIKSKRQLRRLAVLPYDLQVKEAFPESVKHVTEFAKKTGDYPSLSCTDIKVMALAYQLEKEHVGTEHLKTIPTVNRSVNYSKRSAITVEDIPGFYIPKKGSNSESSEFNQADDKNDPDELTETLENCNVNEDDSEYLSAKSDSSDDEFLESSESLNELKSNLTKVDNKGITTSDDNDNLSDDNNDVDEDDNVVTDLFVQVKDNANLDTDDDEKYSGSDSDEEGEESEEEDDDDDSGWITPSNVRQVEQEMDGNNLDDKPVTVACLTTDFAMQNVLKQMGLNVISLDGRVIKQMRTFILRCYACFKTTSVMTKVFCHHCGNKTLKKVAVSLDEKGNQQIHINLRRPLTARGKKFSLPRPTGGKHSNYPILFEDQPVPQQRPTRLARTKNNPLDPDYIAGFSPFVMRDVNSKSAMLGVPSKTKEVKYWMRRNPNESFGRKKKKK